MLGCLASSYNPLARAQRNRLLTLYEITGNPGDVCLQARLQMQEDGVKMTTSS